MNILMEQLIKEWMADDLVLLVLRSGVEVVLSTKDYTVEGAALGDGFIAGYTPTYDARDTYVDELGQQRRFRSKEVVVRLDEIAAVRRYAPPAPPAKGDY